MKVSDFLQLSTLTIVMAIALILTFLAHPSETGST